MKEIQDLPKMPPKTVSGEYVKDVQNIGKYLHLDCVNFKGVPKVLADTKEQKKVKSCIISLFMHSLVKINALKRNSYRIACIA